MQVTLKSQKIDLYSDPRELAKHDTIDQWDTDKVHYSTHKTHRTHHSTHIHHLLTTQHPTAHSAHVHRSFPRASLPSSSWPRW